MLLFQYEQVLAARTLDPEERRGRLIASDYQAIRSCRGDGWNVLGECGEVDFGFDTKEAAEAEILWPLLYSKGLLAECGN